MPNKETNRTWDAPDVVPSISGTPTHWRYRRRCAVLTEFRSEPGREARHSDQSPCSTVAPRSSLLSLQDRLPHPLFDLCR